MERVAQLCMGGHFQPALDGATREVVNPATGEVFGRVAAGGAADVDLAVANAKASFLEGSWSRAPFAHRAQALNRFADLLEENIEEVCQLETLNNGRPIRETRAQIRRLPLYYRYNAALALTLRGDVIPIEGPYLNYTYRAPLGVVALMTSFNHPLLILSKSLAPALAAGNSVVIKPSIQTPFTTVRIVEWLHEAGVPAGVVNLVNGPGEQCGARLAEHPDVSRLVFTGSTEVGRSVGRSMAGHFAGATLELGGKGAVVVFDDLALERTVNGAAFAAFIAAGQTCICGSRILVQRTVYEPFLAAFKRKAEAILCGDPFDERTDMGPVISAGARDRVLGMVAEAAAAGAKLLTGGGVPTDAPKNGFFVEPTVLYDVDPNSVIAQEEVFGPVTVVIPFDTEEEAVAIANGTRYGLGASLWTKDVERAHRVASRLKFGMVWINDHHRSDPASPWGGFGESGIGKEAGIESYMEMTALKSVIVNTTGETQDWYDGSGRQQRLN